MRHFAKHIVVPIIVIVTAILSMFIVHRHYTQIVISPGILDTTVIAKNPFNPIFVRDMNCSGNSFTCTYFDPQMTFEPVIISVDKNTFKALFNMLTALSQCEPFSDEYNVILNYYQFVLYINLGSGEYSLNLVRGQSTCTD